MAHAHFTWPGQRKAGDPQSSCETSQPLPLKVIECDQEMVRQGYIYHE